MNLGRNKLDWSQEIWGRIDQAVHDECKRTKVAAKFLPMYGPISPGDTTVLSDAIDVDGQALSVNETAVTPVVEIITEFKLTLQQVEREQELMTAVTLATRAANLLSQAEDLLIFQGHDDAKKHSLFEDGKVRLLSGNAGTGLLNAPAKGSDTQVVRVPVKKKEEEEEEEETTRWGENTFRAVARAYSNLQSGEKLDQAHYGPYALVLHHVPYADAYAPLKKTLIMPADRIKPLVTDAGSGDAGARFFGTGTLSRPTSGADEPDRDEPAPASNLRGVFVSLGGNTMDLVVGMDATTAFLQEDPDGRYRFRVFERFALRLKDRTSVVRLEFDEKPAVE